jgi:hypothetical protein
MKKVIIIAACLVLTALLFPFLYTKAFTKTPSSEKAISAPLPKTILWVASLAEAKDRIKKENQYLNKKRKPVFSSSLRRF